MTAPLFSVLIDTYNHERFIEEAVRSVLAQDFPVSEREILVVDDGSTDRTPEILRKFEPQVRILRKTNGGQASAFNHGIPECRGQLIAFLDGDDSWTPDKLRVVCDLMAANPSIGMMGHAFACSSEGNAPYVISPDQDLFINLRDPRSALIFRLHRCFFGTSRLILRSDVAQKSLPVPESLVFEADEYLFTIAAALTGALIKAEPLTHYRIHDSNLYMNASGSAASEMRKQGVLESLAIELNRKLPSLGLDPGTVRMVVEIVAAEATQIRLKHTGGWSWETVRTETSLYRMQHYDTPLSGRTLRALSMIPALLLPPRSFYALRGWLSSQRWYLYFRKNVVPAPPPQFSEGKERGDALTR